jgi:hypothetical protein
LVSKSGQVYETCSPTPLTLLRNLTIGSFENRKATLAINRQPNPKTHFSCAATWLAYLLFFAVQAVIGSHKFVPVLLDGILMSTSLYSRLGWLKCINLLVRKLA